MVFLLDKLRLKNNFNLLKLEPSTIEGDKFHYEKPFINHLREVKKEPLLLLKHHFIFDFAQHGLRQPTMINVVRDPVDWFVSQFYFRRNGWARSNTARKSNTLTDQSQDETTVNECVANDMPECFQPVYKYIQYFCGNHDECRTSVVNMKQRSNKRAKINVLREFYVIGVMEQFEDTLEMFEQTLPRFFTGISSLWSTQVAQKARNSTRTSNRKEISAVNRAKMANHALKWEMDLYLFIRALFNEKLKRYNIEPHEIKSTRR